MPEPLSPGPTSGDPPPETAGLPSGRMILALQLQGLGEALRFTLQSGKAPGPLTVELYNKLRADADALADGRALARIPAIGAQSDPGDLLVAAEVLRSTVVACLTPEEHEERERAIGFAAGKAIE